MCILSNSSHDVDPMIDLLDLLICSVTLHVVFLCPCFHPTIPTLQRQRTVYRLTLVKAWNVEEMQAYSELIALGQPDFIEVKVGLSSFLSFQQYKYSIFVVNLLHMYLEYTAFLFHYSSFIFILGLKLMPACNSFLIENHFLITLKLTPCC